MVFHTINSLYHFPVGNSQTAVRGITLVMPLRSTECGKRKLMLFIDAFGNAGKPVVTFERRTLDIAVTPVLTPHKGERPTVLGYSGRNRK